MFEFARSFEVKYTPVPIEVHKWMLMRIIFRPSSVDPLFFSLHDAHPDPDLDLDLDLAVTLASWTEQSQFQNSHPRALSSLSQLSHLVSNT